MTYEEILDRIKTFQKYGSKLGLERMENLLAFMNHPEEQLNVIHVAGTNGKGSVSKYISSVLRTEGYEVGVYFSPFLERFTESIELNGQEISCDDLTSCAEKVLNATEAFVKLGYEPPTEFELITVIAFVFFSWKQTDFVVLEAGMGGVGDSTNVIQSPLVSVITSISYDHMEYLGSTLEEIAAAKAGIIKPHCGVVSMTNEPLAKKVIKDIAERQQAFFIDASGEETVILSKTLDGYRFSVEIMGKKYNNIEITMLGFHQIQNAICAVTAIEYIRQHKQVQLSEKAIYDGMRTARQHGRFEIIRNFPTTILDGAHNVAGVQALIETVYEHFSGKKLLLCTGILQDKQVEEMVNLFSNLNVDVVVTEPINSRKLSAERLKEIFVKKNKEKKNTKVYCYPRAEDAFSFIETQKNYYDVIVYAGSLYLIGKIRGLYIDQIDGI